MIVHGDPSKPRILTPPTGPPACGPGGLVEVLADRLGDALRALKRVLVNGPVGLMQQVNAKAELLRRPACRKGEAVVRAGEGSVAVVLSISCPQARLWAKLLRVSELKHKVFCIGFHRTGTTSLGAALAQLGYRVCGAVGVRDSLISERAETLCESLLPRFDAFRDNPWPVLFRWLDHRCPGSRFILTDRNPDEWIASACSRFGTESTPMREWIYGVGHPIGNEETYVRRFQAHRRAVCEHFAHRSRDLLVMNVTGGDGWAELSSFLGVTAPDGPFPSLLATGQP